MASPPRIPRHPADSWRIPEHYKVVQLIGSGSYGSVVEAEDAKSDQVVAIKRCKHIFEDLTDCKRILREIAILSKLEHNNVVRIHDVFASASVQTFEEIYVVMELADSDLKKLFKTDVNLQPIHLNTMLYHLLVGLKYVHSAGIYHRDLKPANCLVNQDCTVKICDFGLARAVGGELMETPELPGNIKDDGEVALQVDAKRPVPVVPHTQRLKKHLTRHVVTRWYRAPELILLQENYTEAIDMWSVGCIYAEMLNMLEGVHVMDRGPLFPGSSCFPLSPDRRHKTDYRYHAKGCSDMLNKIFSIIGTPKEEEVADLDKEDSKKYIRCFEKRRGEGLKSRFPHVEPASLEILGDMLKFSPRARLSVQSALEHPMLADVREPSEETTAAEVVVLDFEREKELSEPMLRKNFFTEIRKYHPGADDGSGSSSGWADCVVM